ncbi:MAG: DUF4625 domain-containing protein [Bacteroidales bacterium]
MKPPIILIEFIILLPILFISCNKNKTIDNQKPHIDISINQAFPRNCDTLYFGETFTFKASFTDNVELGSDKAFSIDIHNNFEHHSHSTEVNECNLNPKKTPINPFKYIEDFDIPAGSSRYLTDVKISIPAYNANGYFDEGDYHYFISLSDKEGWTTQKGISIKILYRK